MQYKSIQDVPEDQVERAISFIAAALRLVHSKTAARIAQYIADECLLHGQSNLPHKEFERRTGTCRRTVSRALQNLLAMKIIERIEHTEERRSVYRCCWERADEYRAWGKEFDRKWAEARKEQRLKDFQAPTYPVPEAGHGQG